MELRVVTYNVRGFRDGRDRVARVLTRVDPDIVLLNETGGRVALHRLANDLGMQLAADPLSPFRRRVKDAVLARPPWHIDSSRQERFPTASRLYPRGALIAEIGRAGVRVHAVATHLSLHPGERLRHAERLCDLVGRTRTPAILGGDLNDRPDGKAASLLGTRFRDVWLQGGDADDVDGETFPADEPTARIDYVFVTEEFRVERAFVPADPEARTASDHRPVVAVLALPDG